ncbi:MAG: hypothetical protein RLN62_05725 [Rickettsiales bacterium]
MSAMKLPVLLKIQQAENMLEIGGAQSIELHLDNEYIENNQLGNASWKIVDNQANSSSIEVVCNGLFTGQYTDSLIKHYAYSKQKFLMQIEFSNGSYLSGEFLIASLDLSFDLEEEKYQIKLTNASAVEYFAGSDSLVKIN